MHKVPLLKDIICSIVSFRRGESLPPVTSWNLGGGHKAIYSGSYCQGQLEGRKIMLFQIYDYYRDVYFGEKGQDLIEYALVSVKFSSVIHLTVDNYYLRGFGLISISV